jgi:NADH:ubiquinone oxidoreductase subunit 3 (subunit A)
MKVFGNSYLNLFMVLFVSAMLIAWMLPIGLLFAQEGEEEELMEEITGEESEEGSIEVLGFTEENSQVFDNKFYIVVIALVVAAVGGLFLSFVIRGRA